MKKYDLLSGQNGGVVRCVRILHHKDLETLAGSAAHGRVQAEFSGITGYYQTIDAAASQFPFQAGFEKGITCSFSKVDISRFDVDPLIQFPTRGSGGNIILRRPVLTHEKDRDAMRSRSCGHLINPLDDSVCLPRRRFRFKKAGLDVDYNDGNALFVDIAGVFQAR